MRRLGIFGTSGMAREAGDIAYENGFLPLYIARDQAELDSWEFPAEVVLEANLFRYRDLTCVIGIGENQVREKLAQRFIKDVRFVNLIHPSATFGQGQRNALESRQGLIVCAGVRFTSNIQVGDFSIFNQNATIAHDVVVGQFVNVAPGSVISGNVHIGHGAMIGAGAVVNQGTPSNKLYIGNNTRIGSGAVVVKTCDANATYVGIPAKKIK